jgi:hypothetical protein
MSKQNMTGHKAIVAAFVSAYETAENTGSKLAEVCKLATATYKGREIPEEESQAMAQMIADARGWSGDTSKVRRSEICKVFGVYNMLPEGISQVREKRGACNWRDALKLATCLKKSEGNLKTALAAFETKSENGTSTPQGRAASALKGWYKVAKGDKKQKILEAATLLGLKLGIKLDA